MVDQTSENTPSTVSQAVEEKLVHAPAKPEAPVDSMLKDMATIILSTFLLVGWVAFIITYPLVRLDPSHCLCSGTSLSVTRCRWGTHKSSQYVSYLKVNI